VQITDAVRAFIFRKNREANAWRRALLGPDGKLSADGRIILKSLTRNAQYFDVGYIPGDHDRTLILATRRETVNRILKTINFDEASVLQHMREDADE
jgi:hypothetical protein